MSQTGTDTPKVWGMPDTRGWAFDRIDGLLGREWTRRGIQWESILYPDWIKAYPRMQPGDIVISYWWPHLKTRPVPAGVRSVVMLFDCQSPGNCSGLGKVFGDATLACAGNEFLQRMIEEQTGRTDVIRVDDGVDGELFKPGPKTHKGFVAGYVGRTDRDLKRFHLLEEAVKIAARKTKMTLKVADFNSDTASLIPHNEMPEWYHGVDVVCCQSISEGTPNPVLEACACGLPVVSTPVGLVPKIQEANAKIRLLSPDPEPEEIAEQLVRLAGYKQATRVREGKANRRAVLSACPICYDDIVNAVATLVETWEPPEVPPPKWTIADTTERSNPWMHGPTK